MPEEKSPKAVLEIPRKFPSLNFNDTFGCSFVHFGFNNWGIFSYLDITPIIPNYLKIVANV